ncbi:MAG: VWA domain-containing protein, partial [Acidobacteria bacterium]|nr:VWA domain-containing protein [Acidobacteriota bacterium]
MRVNLVLLHTRVIDRTGAPVLDLKQDEFQVFEDGNEKPLAFLAASDVPLHVAMVMDVSTSTRELLPQLRKAAQNFAEQFRPEDRLAVYTIAGSVVRQVQFTVNHGHVRQLLGNLETYDPYGFRGAPERREAVKLPVPGNGGTLLYDGLSAIERDFPAAAQRRVVLVFTDAEDSGSAMTFPELHKKMARGSTAVYAVLPELRRADREKLIQEKVGRSLMTAWPKGTHWFLLWEQTPEPEKEGQKVGDAARMFLEQLPTTDRVWLFHWAGKAQILSHPEAVVAPNEPRFSMSPAQAREIVDGSRKARTEPLPRAEELRKMRADAIVALVPYASRAIQPISNSLREAGGTFAILIPELFAAKEDWQKVAAALTQGPNG